MIAGCTIDEGANNKTPMFNVNQCASIIALCKKQLFNNRKPIYSYVFARKQPGDNVGVPHSCDNRYQFGSLDGCWRPYEKDDYELSSKMTKYWANFASTGNPNGEGLEVWNPYTKEEPLQMKLDIKNCEMYDFNIDTSGNIKKIVSELLEKYGR